MLRWNFLQDVFPVGNYSPRRILYGAKLLACHGLSWSYNVAKTKISAMLIIYPLWGQPGHRVSVYAQKKKSDGRVKSDGRRNLIDPD